MAIVVDEPIINDPLAEPTAQCQQAQCVALATRNLIMWKRYPASGPTAPAAHARERPEDAISSV